MAEANQTRRRLVELAWLFLKLGTTAFGGPAAHIAMLEDEVVRRRGWLTHAEFLDLLGATNLIPGPNSTEMAIHIGHRRAGWPGLIVAGVCFILPAALIVTSLAWTYVRFGKLPQADGLLYGVKPVIIAVVAQALWGLGRTALKTKLLAALGGVAALASFAGVNELLVLFGAGAMMAAIHAAKPGSGVRLGAFIPLLASTTAPSGAAVVAATPFSLGTMLLFLSRSVRCSTAAATCCWRFCARTWWSAGAG
jgi:chromate transporter